MSAPRYCECGKRIFIIAHPKRGRWRARARSRKHDLCQACFERLKNPRRRSA